MEYKIIIQEVRRAENGYPRTEDIYEQIVDDIDITALVAYINKKEK
jgi:hypothetical protein